jgi:hypothetical protein
MAVSTMTREPTIARIRRPFRVLIGGLTILAASPATAGEPVDAAARAAGSGGMRAYVDPATGALRASPDGADAPAASDTGRPREVVPNPTGGGVTVHTEDLRFDAAGGGEPASTATAGEHESHGSPR